MKASASQFAVSFRVIALLALTYPAAGGAPQPPMVEQPASLGPGQCEICHAQLADVRLSTPTASLAFDVHAKRGLGCVACHGGDASSRNEDRAHAKETGFVGLPDAPAILQLCARCHSDPKFMRAYNPTLATDQLDKYKTSRHGQLLEMGLSKVAQCVSCHTAHLIRTPKDPLSTVYPVNIPRTCARCHSDPEYMKGLPVPTDQYAKYSASVHGIALLGNQDLAAPACNGCHGNHGAFPPGAQSLAQVCGTCHAFNLELFEKSPHAEAFRLEELPQCEVCHGYHDITTPTVATFNMGPDSVCESCHPADDAGWKAGKAVYAQISELHQLRDQADALLERGQTLGMDVSDGRFVMRDFHSTLLQLRTLTHSLDPKAFAEKVKLAQSQATKAAQLAQAAVDEFHYRRKGLFVSLALATPVLLLLFIRIRAPGPKRQATQQLAQKEEEDPHPKA